MLQTCNPIILSTKRPSLKQFQPPNISQEEWCDFRTDYEAGMTLKEIAGKYHCDPRTVRKFIMQNRSSHRLGAQSVSTKLEPFCKQIDELYQEYLEQEISTSIHSGICKISSLITARLQSAGYQGSERTVRNYLRQTHPVTIANQSQELTERTKP